MLPSMERAARWAPSSADSLQTDDHRRYLYELLPSFGGPMWLGGSLAQRTCASVVALYGWRCAEPQVLSCGDCGAQLAWRPGEAAQAHTLHASLQSAHHVACEWRAHRVAPEPLLCPSAHTALAQYHRRLATWERAPLPAVRAPPELPVAPAGVDADAHALALLGWERDTGALDTALCRGCARQVELGSAPLDLEGQHRAWCALLHGRALMLRVCRTIPPAAEVPAQLDVPTGDAPQWRWLGELLAGRADVALDPLPQAVLRARALLSASDAAK